MELQNTFTVPVPPQQAFEVLRDIERIGPCMPGAKIDSVDGDHFSGQVKVKIGPIQVTYRGEADYVDVDADALTATIDARGQEARGSGTANAKVQATITDGPDGGATVTVTTDLAITGKPAQFGRGVMADVGEKLIGRFADCLSEELARPAGETGDGDSDESAAGDAESPAAAVTAPATGGGEAAKTPTATSASAARNANRPEPEAIDLIEVAGAPVAKRLAPVVLGIAILAILWRLIGRRG